MMMRNIFLAGLFVLASVGLGQAANFTTYPYDSCTDGVMDDSGGICYLPATTYNLTLKQATLIKSDGDQYPLMDDDEERTYDIASVGINQVVSEDISGVEIPHATYTGFILALDRIVTGTTSNELTDNGKGCGGQNFSSDLVIEGVVFTSLPVCGAGEPNSSVDTCRTTSGLAKFYLPITFTYSGTQAINYSLKINTSRAAQCQFAGAVTTGVGGNGLVEVTLEAVN